MTDTAPRTPSRVGTGGWRAAPGAIRHRAAPVFDVHSPRRVVGLVGTYPPTECGIATFTKNVRDALLGARATWDVQVVRLAPTGHLAPSREVATTWVRGDAASLARAVAVLNACDVVVLQHEFGIFGGDDGADVTRLLRDVTAPLVVQLHTVLREPTAHQRQVLQSVIDAADLVIVPSTSAMVRLRALHRVGHAVVVPHGAAANFAGPAVDSTADPTILTWGLLGPGKGLEHAIEAMTHLRDVTPTPTYVIAGHTHPNLVSDHHDPYRESLRRLVRRLDVVDMVRFDNRYLSWDALHGLVHATSVVLLPYDSRDQICSGVLVEALAAGRPIVATRFPHAVEVLADGTGILVDHEDVAAIAEALRRVLTRPGEAERLSGRSRAKAQRYLWPNVGETFARLLESQITAKRAS